MSLIEKAKLGDMAAQKELFFETVSQVYFICSKLLPTTDQAVSACLATYKRVFSSLENLDENTDFSAWVKTAAAITCCTELRRSDREVFLTVGLDKLGYTYPVFPVETALNMGETAQIMEDCIDSLSLSKRTAVILYYFNGLTVSQIAKVLCVPVPTAKELLVEGRKKLENLQWHLNDIGVKTCSMALLPIFELLSSILIIPDGISYEAVGTGTRPKLDPELPSQETKKKKRKLSLKRVFALILVFLLLAGGLTFAFAKFFFGNKPQKYSFGEALFSLNFDCVSPKLAEISPDSLFVFENQAQSMNKITSDFLISNVIIADSDGQTLKTVTYAYKDNTLVRTTSGTEFLTEQLNYKWTKEGSRLTVTNSEGTVVEQTDYNSEGHPVKQVFPKNTVKYTWTYTYDDKGRIETAKSSSAVSGSYSYKYDNKGRITYKKTKLGGVTETEENVFDDFGMVTKKIITADGGEKTRYTISYDYNKLRFSAYCSDGTTYSGTLITSQE